MAADDVGRYAVQVAVKTVSMEAKLMLRRSVLVLILLTVAYQALGQSNANSKLNIKSALPTASPVVSPTAPPPTPLPSSSPVDAKSTTQSPKEAESNSWLSGELISGLIGAIVGALFGSGASQFLATRHAKKQMKIETLRRFVAYRFDVIGAEFTQVLNEILIVYADSTEVTAALNNLAKGSNNERLVALYKAMCGATGVKNVSDELFLTAFNVRKP